MASCDKSLREAQEKSQHLQLTLRKSPDCSAPRDWLLGSIPKFWGFSMSLPQHSGLTRLLIIPPCRELVTLGHHIQLPARKCREKLGTGKRWKGHSAASLHQLGRTKDQGSTCSGKGFSCLSHWRLQEILSPLCAFASFLAHLSASD